MLSTCKINLYLKAKKEHDTKWREMEYFKNFYSKIILMAGIMKL